MARKQPRPRATSELTLEPLEKLCRCCGTAMWVAYHGMRTVATLEGLVRLRLVVRRCVNPECECHRRFHRPEGEGALALPQGEFGLDVIALVGALRHAQHRSVPEIHRELSGRGVRISERTVTNLLERYEELVAVRLSDRERLGALLSEQGHVILALDGLQPDKGHEVLWVLRDCVSGEVLLARSLLGGPGEELAKLLGEVKGSLPAGVEIRGVISDGEHAIRNAVKSVLPGVAHQLCQFHYLREAARPAFEADRHAKTELKKHVRGVRPIERELEGREDTDEEAQAIRGYCLAVRSAITDDGRPPLSAPGLKLHERIGAIHSSIRRGGEKRGSRESWNASASCSSADSRGRPRFGPTFASPTPGRCGRRGFWRTRRA